MNESLRSQVRERAGDCCEYCQLPQAATIVTHEADHIRSQKHNGPSTLDNLCWACAWCNAFKGSDIAGFDPLDDSLTPLFNPRAQQWSEHFAWNGPLLLGLTPSGRTTVALLRINDSDRLEHRRLLRQLRLP
jgi:hypothetical protein